MTSNVAGKSVAILVANGFDENAMTEIQRALIKEKAKIKTIAPEQGVVNGWQGAGWGHYFPVDGQINETLGSDFDMLILPGGERAMAKLKNNLHTRRIVNHFVDAGKPVAAIGAGVALLALADAIKEYRVAAPADAVAELTQVGATISEDAVEHDNHILTANGEDMASWVAQTLGLVAMMDDERAAA